jgi:hypothetical protein
MLGATSPSQSIRRALALRSYSCVASNGLTQDVDEILEYLAMMARGYDNHLKWNEEAKLKGDPMNAKSRWRGVPVSEIRDRCRALGMREEDATLIAGLVTKAQAGRRLVPQKSYRDFRFRPSGPGHPALPDLGSFGPSGHSREPGIHRREFTTVRGVDGGQLQVPVDQGHGAAEASAGGEGRVLTTVKRQELWASADLRPAAAMVWMPAHAGAFLHYLDSIGERLAALFAVTMYCGFRRDEVLGLTWAEVEPDEGVAYVRQTASGSGPKSDAGTRVVPLPTTAIEALKAWRKVHVADRLAWGPDWLDSGRVFTREDGSEVPAQWTSTRFEILAYRAGLPPVRFHDLRHGTASLMKAARIDTKIISALGHSRTSFTDSQYVTLFPEVHKAAAEAAAAMVPRRTAKEGGVG